MTTRQKLGLLAALYLAQGLPYGFFTQALPVLLRSRGLSLEAIGLTSLLALPWALKFAWAPAVDRLGSRRRWILVTQAASAAALLGLATLNPEAGLGPILAGVFLINALAATQDIATDGLAVRLLTHGERGLGNGVQVAGYRVGMMLGGGALLVAAGALGWPGIFLVMAGLIALSSVPVWRVGEGALAVSSAGSAGSASTVNRQAPPPARRLSAGWLGLLLVFKSGDALAQGMLRPWLVDRGMSLEAIGALVGGLGFGAGLAGALAGGVWMSWIRRTGRSEAGALARAGLLQAAAVGGYALVAAGGALDGAGGLALACGLEHFAGGVATAALFTCMMARCRPERASTDYTLQASAVVIASGAAAAVSGVLASRLGWPVFFGLATALALLGAAAAALWSRSTPGDTGDSEQPRERRGASACA